MSEIKQIISSLELMPFQKGKEGICVDNICPLNNFICNDNLHLPELKNIGGVYVFWWSGNINKFTNALNSCSYYLKAKRSHKELIKIQFTNEWVENSTINRNICLYIGKSTDLKSRISKHLKLGTKDIWNKSKKISGIKPNSESQLRIGVERVFNKSILDGLIDDISISWVTLDGYENAINRFYLENYFIGKLFPLFNIDIER
ncbi:MAG: hypothetical protein A2033_17840 [Bacteroidetes bacterium GWA2_31_9]|nr:MAG: hypothetical protein A2033_17840 [Bacteroidetes bacterium GWA2_31_9]